MILEKCFEDYSYNYNTDNVWGKLKKNRQFTSWSEAADQKQVGGVGD